MKILLKIIFINLKKKLKEIVVDIETTGLDFKHGDKIIEIACVELSNFLPTGKVFQKYCNPEKKVGESVKIHNIKDEFLKNKPLFKETIPEFLEFIKDSPLIIHNSLFDVSFINNELKLNNFNILKNPIIDTLIIARQKFPGSLNGLDHLCRRFNIDLSVRKTHGALVDANLTAKIYLELKGGEQPNFNLDLKKEKLEEKEQKTENFENKKWEPRNYKLTENEIKEHEKTIKKIKGPLWKLYN